MPDRRALALLVALLVGLVAGGCDASVDSSPSAPTMVPPPPTAAPVPLTRADAVAAARIAALRSGGGEIIVLDAFDGHIINRYDWIS